LLAIHLPPKEVGVFLLIYDKMFIKQILRHYFNQVNVKPLDNKNNGFIFVLDGLKANLIDISNSFFLIGVLK